MSHALNHRYRLHLSVPDTTCPECDEALSEDQLSGGPVTCRSCAHVWEPELEAADPLTDERRRFRFLSEVELYRRLAAIARERNNTIGRCYLAEHDPELLFNCVVHHSSYTTARRHLRRWMASNPPPEPTIVVRPRDDAAAINGPEVGTVAEADPETGTSDSAIVLRLKPAGVDSGLGRICPYCRDVFEQDDPAFTCECGATFHPECREELQRCATLGCGASYERPPGALTAAAALAAEEEDVGFLTALHRRLFGHRLRHSYSVPWALKLTGLFAALVGLAGTYAPGAHAPGILALTVPLLVVGLVGALGCRGATIDNNQGWVRTWVGLKIPFLFAVPLWNTTGRLSLDTFSEVRFSEDVWGGDDKGGGVTVYPIALDDQVLSAEHNFIRARRLAERVGNYVGLGVRDTVRGRAFRPAGTLDRPLVDGIHYEPRIGDQPKGGGLTVTRTEGEPPTYTVPGRLNLSALVVVAMLTVLAAATFIGANFPWPLAALGLVPLALTTLRAVQLAAADTLFVSQDGLTLERRWWLGSDSWTLSSNELEELVVSNQKRRTLFGDERKRLLNVISDDRVLEVGAGLDDDELNWLRSSLARDLLHTQTRRSDSDSEATVDSPNGESS